MKEFDMQDENRNGVTYRNGLKLMPLGTFYELTPRQMTGFFIKKTEKLLPNVEIKTYGGKKAQDRTIVRIYKDGWTQEWPNDPKKTQQRNGL